MTREELIRKRKQKKAIRLGLKAAGVVLAVIVLILMIRGIGNWIKNRPKKPKPQTEETVETTETPEVKEDVQVEGDTAQLVTLGSAMTASAAGWNVNDNGWFYSPDLTQMYSAGWKTLDGEKYYFKEDGYMATGWTDVGEVKDKYFDISGRVDETKQQKLVALTFDDGPAESTSKLLDVLEKYGVKATFFVVGEQADYYRETLKREADLGMEIGSHTWDHPWLNQLSEEEIREEMDKNDQLVSEITGLPAMKLMRPTGGGISENMLNTIDKPMIQWDVDTLDWDHKDADQTYQRIVDLVQDGSVVLMHDLFSPSADAADRYISALIDMGYKCVTVSELAEAYGYDMEAAGQYYAFYPGGTEQNKTKAEGLENPVAAWDE
ncbi:MAG: polysaccharide deacetylase family protein [Lachnospiraceae bacterium]|nr:polysaccharide deacetylase family protein [Lachnospiraceae bacterium]